ncbi:MAG: acetylornithine/succinylornithine family transaminase [Spirochaetaceae bacterium]|jgi:acetylornithine/N-succinyldiaminopimelate aminotransferase|nr:acetylornithine/succinylornithine family transaminase [Spirochaetaceae bacterium]
MAGFVVNNYGSFPVVFVSGKGSTLTDRDGKSYIDFVAGIGVNCLGHGHPALVKAVQDQAQRALHVSNYYLSDRGLAFAEALLKATGMERVYFCNSGAEANEAAIKLARKYGWLASGSPAGTAQRHVIVTLEKSFHGRTIATLRATGQEVFHAPAFAPYPEGFRHIRAGDFGCLSTAFDDTVAALMIECVQGEGGVNPVDPAWVRAAAEAARNAGALVIADEVQTGMGRTGALLASESWGIEPDVVTLAKAIAGGIPAGACAFRGKARDVFVSGDHQSTFAGNPLVCACGLVVLQELTRPGFLSGVTQKGDAIKKTIASWNLPFIANIRGAGLMLGMDLVPDAMKSPKNARDVQTLCLNAGLCISTAGENTLRFLPPLVITGQEIDRGLAIFKTVLESL